MPALSAASATAAAAAERRSRRGMTVSVTLLGATLFTVLAAYLVFGDSNDQQALASIRQVHILFRHGHRTPTDTYPKDPHRAHDWPGGLGALTTLGALQTYTLGRNLHARYHRLLPANSLYTRANLLAHSSAAERCLQSAAAMLAGLLPPLEQRHQLPIAWQPVPITSTPRHLDTLLAQKRPCARYDAQLQRLWSDNTTTAELRQLAADSAELFAYLTRHTGLNVTHVRHVEQLYNTVEVQQANGLALPAWAEDTDVYPERMRRLAERTLRVYTETPYMLRMRGGALLTVWLDNMLARRQRTLQPDRALFVYAAHDVTMVNVARALGVLERTAERPEYAAALVLELHHSVIYPDDMEVRLVYYLNGEDKLPKAVPMAGCAEPCALAQFERWLEPVVMRDYEELCRLVV